MEIEIMKKLPSEGDILNFINSAEISHKIDIQNPIEWFKYKFFSSPYGNSIIVIAKENSKYVGCVAFGRYKFSINNIIVDGGISYETFVHPDFRNKGVFQRLIRIAEIEAKNSGCQVLMNFPNQNSLKGFLNAGWKKLDQPSYLLKIIQYGSIIKLLKNYNAPFVVNNSFSLLNSDSTAHSIFERIKESRYINCSYISNDFYIWRFLENPNSKYGIFSHKDAFIIYRTGTRNSVNEIQLIHIFGSTNEKAAAIKKFFSIIKSKSIIDVISMSLPVNNNDFSLLKHLRFFKMNSSTNVLLKTLNSELIIPSSFTFSPIDYHTY